MFHHVSGSLITEQIMICGQRPLGCNRSSAAAAAVAAAGPGLLQDSDSAAAGQT